ncbi:hypothetical protein AABC73_03620 [Pseudomonas sp. G.S.17]|uniref:hypothetical protein n=1 Tax=Pseudomonas sp. G.S.17 TaxID=3137451 RepID=UPI00311CD06B
MKKLLFCYVALVIYFAANYGYYYYLEDASPEAVFFEKEYLTLQVRFDNIFANQSDGKRLDQLSSDEREKVIAYCKFRLGIITELSTEDELEQCKYGSTPLHFRRQYQIE